MFTQSTAQAINAVADQLAADAGKVSPLDLAELVLDANRLGAFGYQAAEAEADELIAAHGFAAVQKAAARLLR